MRGRLIFPLFADVYRYNGTATFQDPDFREPGLGDVDGDGLDDRERPELPVVRVPCQVEPKSLEELNITPSGNAPKSVIDLVFHFRDLQRLGLVDPQTQAPLIAPPDRLGAIYDRAGALAQHFPNPPGLFARGYPPVRFGLGRRPQRALLVVRFADRPLARS